VRFVQITRAERHGFNKDHAIAMLKQLKPTLKKLSNFSIEIALVVPDTDDPPEFNVEGDWPKEYEEFTITSSVNGFTRT